MPNRPKSTAKKSEVRGRERISFIISREARRSCLFLLRRKKNKKNSPSHVRTIKRTHDWLRVFLHPFYSQSEISYFPLLKKKVVQDFFWGRHPLLPRGFASAFAALALTVINHPPSLGHQQQPAIFPLNHLFGVFAKSFFFSLMLPPPRRRNASPWRLCVQVCARVGVCDVLCVSFVDRKEHVLQKKTGGRRFAPLFLFFPRKHGSRKS